MGHAHREAERDNVKALVTGAAGVIGTELVKQLRQRGYEVTGVDWKAGTDVRLDLTDPREEWPGFPEPDILFHLAASFERSVESPGFWEVNWLNNMTATHNVLSLAREWLGLHTFVFASSYLVYDPSAYLVSGFPVTLGESDKLSPRNLCGAAKLYGEQALSFVAAHHPQMRPISARIFRVYGKGSHDVISRWIRAGLDGLPIEVYNRRARFSYIYAGDVAEALVRLAESNFEGGPVNVTCAWSHTIDDVLRILGRHFDLNIHDRGVQGSVERSGGRIERLRAVCGWSPPLSLAKGIAKCIEYERSHHKRVA